MDMKKMGTALLTGVLAASLLAGCGSSQKAPSRRYQCDLRSF